MFTRYPRTSGDKEYICLIRYWYDYIGDLGSYLKPPPLKLNAHMQSLTLFQMNDEHPRNNNHTSISQSEIAISNFPLAAGLPLATGLKIIQQTKHWKTGVAIITKLNVA